jgi:hypothetical protein
MPSDELGAPVHWHQAKNQFAIRFGERFKMEE